MKNHMHSNFSGRVLTVLAASLILALPLCGALPKGHPDYTKGEGPKKGTGTWSFGSTGVTGYIYNHSPRQLLIDVVLEGSPAVGKLRPCDAILGVVSPAVPGTRNGMFTSDAHRVLSQAIEEAEKKRNGGKLVLSIWRPEVERVPVKSRFKRDAGKTKLVVKKPVRGKAITVTLKLDVMGTFSATSPWNCTKAKAIIDESAQAILKKGFLRGSRRGKPVLVRNIDCTLDALGLLATGEQKYMPTVREYARSFVSAGKSLDIMTPHTTTWVAGYSLVFLTEYYLHTKDEALLPAIKSYAVYLGKGVSGVGTWTHGPADIKANGGLYGPSGAYGSMNQAGMVATVGLVLAQKCGIKDRYVDKAVELSLEFLRYYVDKGCVPYGDHEPKLYHDNNGRMSIGAVLFDLVGRKKEANYFARMTVASHAVREGGHTGHYFATQWGALGAARGGPKAAQSFIRNTRYFTEIERRHDGSCVYQTQLRGNNTKYGQWATTGQRLMQHCLPRKVLYITGKGGTNVTPVVGEELKRLEDAGRFRAEGLTAKDLLAALGHWSLVVRAKAAEELGKRDDNVVNELIAMLKSSNRFTRYGACVGLKYAGRKSARAADAMIAAIEQDRDHALRFFAVDAFAQPLNAEKALGAPSPAVISSLLKVAIALKDKPYGIRKLSGQIAAILLYDKRGDKVKRLEQLTKGGEAKVDRRLLVTALKVWLTDPNGMTRTQACRLYAGLSTTELENLWGEIYHATVTPAPSGVMFAGGVRGAGVGIMAKHHIKEGLDAGAWYVFEKDGWGNMGRKIGGIPALAPYGMALKPYFSDIEDWVKRLNGKRGYGARRRKMAEALQAMKKTPAPKMKSIAKHIRKDSKRIRAERLRL